MFGGMSARMHWCPRLTVNTSLGRARCVILYWLWWYVGVNVGPVRNLGL
jgi:hypothetical protein